MQRACAAASRTRSRTPCPALRACFNDAWPTIASESGALRALLKPGGRPSALLSHPASVSSAEGFQRAELLSAGHRSSLEDISARVGALASQAAAEWSAGPREQVGRSVANRRSACRCDNDASELRDFMCKVMLCRCAGCTEKDSYIQY